MIKNKKMKEKKNVQPSPIVFKLNNIPPNGDSYSLIFASIDVLLQFDEATVTQYFEHLNCFTIDNYYLLSGRVMEKRNKELNMNQQHLIIFYASVHLMMQALVSKKQAGILKSRLEETSIEIFNSNKDEMVEFCRTTNKVLRKDYKNNNAIIVAFAKIDAYSIVEQEN